MRFEERDLSHDFEKGQIWKLDPGYVYIVDLGKRLIHYRILQDPNQKSAATRLIRIEVMATYLHQNGAELLDATRALAA